MMRRDFSAKAWLGNLRASWSSARNRRATEHPILAKHRGFVHSPLVAFLLSWGALIIGVWTALDQDHLEQSTKLGYCVVQQHAAKAWARDTLATYSCQQGPALANPARAASAMPRRIAMESVTWDRSVIFFWLVLIGLTYSLWRRLKADDEKDVERTSALIHALHRTPNLNVVRDYPAWLANVRAALFDNWPEGSQSPDERREIIATNIRSALYTIALMAREFARADGARYGANVMLYLPNVADTLTHYPRRVLDTLRFHEPSAAATFQGLLYLTAELLLPDVDAADADDAGASTGAKRHIPAICLAVLRRNDETQEYDLAIPGAPAAVIQQDECGLSVHEDTRAIERECTGFDQRIRDRIKKYFSPEGDGRDIASFASWRIGSRDDPVGVLNIDSDKTRVLGTEPEYYVTFSALVTPILIFLQEALEDYIPLVMDELAQMDVSQPAAVDRDSLPDGSGGASTEPQ